VTPLRVKRQFIDDIVDHVTMKLPPLKVKELNDGLNTTPAIALGGLFHTIGLPGKYVRGTRAHISAYAIVTDPVGPIGPVAPVAPIVDNPVDPVVP
jgi:hypothetical protein